MRHLLIAASCCLLLAACSDKPAPAAAATAGETPPATSPAAAVAPATAAVASAAISGEKAFATCVACHTHEAGGAQRVGPNLHGVIGRKAGSSAGFAYSPALKASGITWDAATLDAFLAAPTRQVPGTRMVVAVPDADTRKALIAYLSAP